MNVQCPKCGSTEFRKLSLVYAEGFSDLETRSRGWGLILGLGGAGVGFGRAKTRGHVQTRLSQQACPPHKKSYWRLLSWGLVGLVILEFVLGYTRTILGQTGNFEEQLTRFGYAYFGVLVFLLWLTWRYNRRVFPDRRRLWNRSFICRCCGHILKVPEPSDPAGPALVRAAVRAPAGVRRSG